MEFRDLFLEIQKVPIGYMRDEPFLEQEIWDFDDEFLGKMLNSKNTNDKQLCQNFIARCINWLTFSKDASELATRLYNAMDNHLDGQN